MWAKVLMSTVITFFRRYFYILFTRIYNFVENLKVYVVQKKKSLCGIICRTLVRVPSCNNNYFNSVVITTTTSRLKTLDIMTLF